MTFRKWHVLALLLLLPVAAWAAANGILVQPDPSNGQASFRTTAGGAAPGQTVKQFSGKVALSATVTTTVNLYTVTAGKTFLITDIYLCHDSAAVVDTQIQAAGVSVFRAPVKGDTAPVQLAGIETPPMATSAQAVTILYPVTAGPPSAYYFVSGIEQ